MTVIIFLLLTFLTYYFINSFNTIKVYTLGGSGEHFEIHDGIFITTKTKTYLKLGDIEFHDNEEINNIRVYYKKGTEQKLIFENKDLDKIIIDTSGYNEMFIEKDIPDMIKNVYAEIIYNENQTETIKIQFVRDFTNAEYLFHKNRKVTRLDPKPLKDNELEQKAISIIKEKGILEGENYILDIKEKNIRFSYHPEAGQIIMNENEEAKWTIFVDTGTYYCFESELENPKECQKQVKESIEKYLLEE